MHDQVGVTLQGVDDDGVLVDVVHWDGREVDALADGGGHRRPAGSAFGEHGCTFGVVGHAGHVRADEHEVSVVRTEGGHLDEGVEDPGHVLEPVPSAHLDDEAGVVRWRGTVGDQARVVTDRADGAVAAFEVDGGVSPRAGDESDGAQDAGDGVLIEFAVLGRERVDGWRDHDEPVGGHPLGHVLAP